MVPRFSVVIPARNEAVLLPRLLDSIQRARVSFEQGPERVEVIVADNASTDGTAQLASDRGCRVVSVQRRAISSVRNGGADVASGELLAFVDADARIHPDTFNAIDRAMSSGRVVAGATGVILERLSMGIGLTYALLMPIVWVTGLDTGVVFCRRADFLAVGGYRENLRFAEDVRFLWDMKKLGRKRGQKLARVTSAQCLASTRKFDKYGDWHYLRLISLFIPWLFHSGRRMESFAQEYWYDDRG
ncbi:MAG: glycosyltransferase [Gemmatimonadales bacterium]